MSGKSYGTFGELDEATVNDIFREYPEFEEYLRERILRTYDDDLKVFLMKTFEHIDYFKDLEKKVLVHLAFCMESEKLEANDIVFLAEDDYPKMIIILDGCLELYTEMDSGTHYPIEYLNSGSVINAHQFMINRKSTISCRCTKVTTFYTLSADKFFEIASNYKSLSTARNEQYMKAQD